MPFFSFACRLVAFHLHRRQRLALPLVRNADAPWELWGFKLSCRLDCDDSGFIWESCNYHYGYDLYGYMRPSSHRSLAGPLSTHLERSSRPKLLTYRFSRHVYLRFHMYTYLSTYLPIYLPIYLSTDLPIYLSIYPSSLCVCVCAGALSGFVRLE